MGMEDKIAKLLAMAEGTTNPHEAESFMAKAEELMLQHGIERAQLEARRPGHVKREIVIKRIHILGGHGYAMAMVQIGHAVGPSFSVKTLQSNAGEGRILWLVGHTTDVDDAERLVNSLLPQSVAQAKAWWRKEGKSSSPFATDNEAYLARREFIFAFASGVRSRLDETRNRVVAEAGAGTELVLVDRAKVVQSWIDDNLETGKARRTNRRAGTYEAVIAGREAGRDSVNSKAVTS